MKILLKIKEVFNDENIFDFIYQEYILQYFIKKCKENDKEVIKEYKKHKISELFINQDPGKNILLKFIKE